MVKNLENTAKHKGKKFIHIPLAGSSHYSYGRRVTSQASPFCSLSLSFNGNLTQ